MSGGTRVGGSDAEVPTRSTRTARQAAKPLLAASLISMVVSVVVGIFRLMNIHSLEVHPTALAVLYPIHPYLGVLGFILPLLMTERMVGSKILGLGRSLDLSGAAMVPLTVLGVMLQVASFLSGVRALGVAGGALTLIALLFFIYLLWGLSSKTDVKLPFYFMILSVIPLLWFAASSTNTPAVEGLRDALPLLVFPVLYVFGERVELSRFIAKLSPATYWTVFALSLAAATLVTAYSALGLGGVALAAVFTLLLAATAVMVYSEAKNFARTAKSPIPLQRYVGRHIAVGYAWLVAGSLFGVAYAANAPGYMYDALIHSLAVGYVGTMMLGHGPVILPSVTGRKVDQSKLTLTPLVLLTLSNTLRVVGDIQLPAPLQGAVSFAAGISGWLLLVAVAVFLRTMLLSSSKA